MHNLFPFLSLFRWRRPFFPFLLANWSGGEGKKEEKVGNAPTKKNLKSLDDCNVDISSLKTPSGVFQLGIVFKEGECFKE